MPQGKPAQYVDRISVDVELHPAALMVIFLIVRSPVPGVLPEVGDAHSGQQF